MTSAFNPPHRPLAELLAELETAVRAGNRMRAEQLAQLVAQRLATEANDCAEMERRVRVLLAELDRVPDIVAKSFDPFDLEKSATLVDEGWVYPVWFGTNRKPTAGGSGFTSERHDRITRGRIEVFVPEAHRFGETGASFWEKFKRRDFRDDHLRLQQLTRLEQAFLNKPWAKVRDGVQVKRLVTDEDVYVLAKSDARIDKEQAMRRKRLRRYIDRLETLQGQSLTRDQLLMKLGAAKHDAGRAANLVRVSLPKEVATTASLEFRLDRAKLRQVRRREGRYLLRTNLTAQQPEALWSFYIQLTEVEQAFKEIKHDLAVRPIFHKSEDRIEAHRPVPEHALRYVGRRSRPRIPQHAVKCEHPAGQFDTITAEKREEIEQKGTPDHRDPQAPAHIPHTDERPDPPASPGITNERQHASGPERPDMNAEASPGEQADR